MKIFIASGFFIMTFFISSASLDQVKDRLGDKGDLPSHCAIVNCHLQEQVWEEAMTALNNIPVQLPLDEEEQEIYDEFQALVELLVTGGLAGLSVEEIYENNVAAFVDIVDSNIGIGSAQARYLVNLIDYKYTGVMQHPLLVLPQELGQRNAPKTKLELADELTANPNPAKEQTTFDYRLKNSENATILVYSISGEEIARLPVSGYEGSYIWDTSMLNSGVYFYSFLSSAAHTAPQKLIIIK